ncbi:MAG: 50S ribosomal protein L21 [Acidobacteria bacterium]|nr:50S ribosomal protein L21 [Acidobacteriota bacterium]
MYAIIQTRGRQLKVTPGAVVEIDGTPGESGSPFSFDQVLLIEKDAGDIVAGAPYVANAKVIGVVDGEARGPKLRVFKKKRRKGFRKTRGHRSVFTRVRITEIQS